MRTGIGPILRWAATAWVLVTGTTVSAYAGPAATDAGAAYCHAQERRQPLIDAAVGLRLATDAGNQLVGDPQKGTLSLEQWEKERPSAYLRACDALIGAAQLSEPRTAARGSGVTTVLLPVALGAVLALASGEWRVHRDRRHQLANALRTSAAAFRREGSSLVRAWSRTLSRPSPDGFFAQLDGLITKLTNAGSQRSLQGATTLLIAELTGPKPRKLADDWPSDHTARQRRARGVEEWLAALESDVSGVADRTERLLPQRRRQNTAHTKPVE